MPLKSFLIILMAAVAPLAAGCGTPQPARAFSLIEKGPYQALYGPGGRLERLAYDGNGDGRAEVVTFFRPSGKPLRAEIDSDGDGVVDRWEVFSAAGVLERVGLSRGGSGVPDEWDYVDATGAVLRREIVASAPASLTPPRR